MIFAEKRMFTMKLSSPIYKLKRKAKLLARTNNLKLFQALNEIAKTEGFASWGHLASNYSQNITPAKKLISQLYPGDMMLIGARPGHGKTLLGLELAALANTINRGSYIFSLDYNDKDTFGPCFCNFRHFQLLFYIQKTHVTLIALSLLLYEFSTATFVMRFILRVLGITFFSSAMRIFIVLSSTTRCLRVNMSRFLLPPWSSNP